VLFVRIPLGFVKKEVVFPLGFIKNQVFFHLGFVKKVNAFFPVSKKSITFAFVFETFLGCYKT
jgi:hypothetical protein